jgi:Ca-activated chloride channel family protein
MGTPFVVENGEKALATAERFRKYIQQPVLTNIKVNFEGFDVYDVEPLSMADVFAERPLVIFGKYKGNAEGSINISGISGDGKYVRKIAVRENMADERNSALTYLWAREKIRVLDDYASLDMYTNAHEEEITALGLKYNLLTQYTSFVAIDNLVRNEDGSYTTVSQPLPLPEGVSNYAVGGGPVSMQKSSSKAVRFGGIFSRNAASEEYVVEDASVEPEPDPVYDLVDQMAEFTGHKPGIETFIAGSIIYPLDALAGGLEGHVYVEFIIEVDGSISEVTIISSSDSVFEMEALRVIRLTDKKWKPAKLYGRKVRSRMVVEVPFKLSE